MTTCWRQHALALVAVALAEHPDAAMVYSDEDKIDEAGRRRDPFFKPDFDPLLLTGQNFVSHLRAFRKDLVDRAGGYREGYEGSQDWDLTLRVSEQLVERRRSCTSPMSCTTGACTPARRRHSCRPSPTPSTPDGAPWPITWSGPGGPGQVTRIGKSGHNRVAWALPDPAPRVSIVVPTRDGRLLQRCIDSVLAFTRTPTSKWWSSTTPASRSPTLQYLQGYDDRFRVLRDERPFNYAELNNAAVQRTDRRRRVPPQRRHRGHLR